MTGLLREWKLAALLLAATALAACATTEGEHTVYGDVVAQSGQPRPAPGTPGSAPGAPTPVAPLPTPAPLPAVPAKPAPNYPREASDISNSAVVSLLKQAREARAAGKLDLADSKLASAQRIEPRNYFVWSAIAQLRLDQKQYAQAENLAVRSNSLSRGNKIVQLQNWKTIAAARKAEGDQSGLVEAQARVEVLQAGAGGE